MARGNRFLSNGSRTFDPILEGTRRVYFGSWSAIRCPRNFYQFTRSAAPWPENWPAIHRQRKSNRQPRPAVPYVWSAAQGARAGKFNCQTLEIKKAATGAACSRYERFLFKAIGTFFPLVFWDIFRVVIAQHRLAANRLTIAAG